MEQELDKVISGWGDQVCHAPVLLAWMAFKFIALPKTDLEVKILTAAFLGELH